MRILSQTRVLNAIFYIFVIFHRHTINGAGGLTHLLTVTCTHTTHPRMVGIRTDYDDLGIVIALAVVLVPSNHLTIFQNVPRTQIQHVVER